MDALLKLEGDGIYTCTYCDAHLALEDDVICKSMIDFMFAKMVNVVLGEKYFQDVSNGRHTLKDVHCAGCGSLLGFKYEALPRMDPNLPEPHYKAGNYVLTRAEFSGPVTYPPVVQDQRGGGGEGGN